MIFTCIRKWLLHRVEKHGEVIGRKMILSPKCWQLDSVRLEFQGTLMKNFQNSGNLLFAILFLMKLNTINIFFPLQNILSPKCIASNWVLQLAPQFGSN